MSDPRGTVLFRADANPTIGAGHALRSLALAQAWRNLGGDAALATAELPQPIAERWVADGVSVERLEATPGSADDRAATVALAAARGASWAVLDGYRFGNGFTTTLQRAGVRVLRIDDIGRSAVADDAILNPNLHADLALYPRRRAGTRFFLGTRYALLRREFARPVVARRAQHAERLLVTFGGSDPMGLTLPAVRAVAAAARPGLSLRVVVGGATRADEALRRQIEEAHGNCEVVDSAPDMAVQMDWADASISAAGATTWELLNRGVPSLLIPVADNQRPTAVELQRRGAALIAMPEDALEPERLAPALVALLEDAELRRRLAAGGPALVDGGGAARVARALAPAPLVVRRAAERDARPLWRWANDTESRRASFEPEPIPWRTHLRWLEARLADPRCTLLVAEGEGAEPVGTVRFEPADGRAVISVNVAPEVRGRGLGPALICAGLAALADTPQPPEAVDAYIRPDNPRSLAAFAQAGFELTGETVKKGPRALKLSFPLTAVSTPGRSGSGDRPDRDREAALGKR
ncbi:MAG TPA: UDP-2,4-diacetamido-2,4,6-trideoxy-beta-L-altropyranose hydrolase [Thermoanaerobaculia bacterium]|nr:UDP-2,4-diacetamido-2,4,6-trideoxy-beta-L-altropyranose hydrolase [Thermoanaerobaculia bacterium]